MTCWIPTARKAAALLVLLAFVAPDFAWAAKPLTRAQKDARASHKKAKKAYELGQFEEALAAYTEAYRLEPVAATLFNIAQCHRQMNQYQKAAFFYGRYLSQAKKPIPNEKVARELMAEMMRKEEEERQQRLSAEVDVVPLGTPDVPTAPGAASARLAPRPGQPTSQAVSAAPSTERVSDTAKPDSILNKWWFWTGVGVLAAGAGAALVVTNSPKPSPATLGEKNLRP